jgi:hypothetical protein
MRSSASLRARTHRALQLRRGRQHPRHAHPLVASTRRPPPRLQRCPVPIPHSRLCGVRHSTRRVSTDELPRVGRRRRQAGAAAYTCEGVSDTATGETSARELTPSPSHSDASSSSNRTRSSVTHTAVRSERGWGSRRLPDPTLTSGLRAHGLATQHQDSPRRYFPSSVSGLPAQCRFRASAAGTRCSPPWSRVPAACWSMTASVSVGCCMTTSTNLHSACPSTRTRAPSPCGARLGGCGLWRLRRAWNCCTVRMGGCCRGSVGGPVACGARARTSSSTQRPHAQRSDGKQRNGCGREWCRHREEPVMFEAR